MCVMLRKVEALVVKANGELSLLIVDDSPMAPCEYAFERHMRAFCAPTQGFFNLTTWGERTSHPDPNCKLYCPCATSTSVYNAAISKLMGRTCYDTVIVVGYDASTGVMSSIPDVMVTKMFPDQSLMNLRILQSLRYLQASGTVNRIIPPQNNRHVLSPDIRPQQKSILKQPPVIVDKPRQQQNPVVNIKTIPIDRSSLTVTQESLPPLSNRSAPPKPISPPVEVQSEVVIITQPPPPPAAPAPVPLPVAIAEKKEEDDDELPQEKFVFDLATGVLKCLG